MTIDSNGNIGIGTTAPTFKLDVAGTGRFTGALRLDSTLLDKDQQAGTSGQLLSSTGTQTEWVDAATAAGGSFADGSVIFSNGTSLAEDNANFFFDDTNNRLGIGTTAPGAKLALTDTTAVVDGTNAYGQYIDADPTTSGAITSNYTYYTGSNIDIDFADTDNSTKLRLQGQNIDLNLNSGAGDILSAYGETVSNIASNGTNASVSLKGQYINMETYTSNTSQVIGSSIYTGAYGDDATTSTITSLVGLDVDTITDIWSANAVVNVADQFGAKLDSGAWTGNYSGAQGNITRNYGGSCT